MIYYADGSKSSMGSQIVVTDISGNLLIKMFLEPELTSNEIEYYALIVAANKAEPNAKIFSDSELCVRQINDTYKIRKKNLQKLAELLRKKKIEKNLTFEWISREANLAGHILEKIIRKNTKSKQSKKNKLNASTGGSKDK